jgi:hypothetical protein
MPLATVACLCVYLTLANPVFAEESSHATATVAQKYGEVALAFEPNQGQAPEDVRFLSRGEGITVLAGEQHLTLIAGPSSRNRASSIQMKFPGASFLSPPIALQPQEGISNYLLGDDPAAWHTNVPNFGSVRYPGIYPGIDLVLYGNHRRLEHDFVVAPGADYRSIHVRLEGARDLIVNERGELTVQTASGHFTFRAPDVYQQHGAANRVAIDGRYLLTASNEFAFQVGSYDHALPLVIDPVLGYSTYLAGSNADIGNSIAIDKNGYAYVTGVTWSIDFPVANAEQGTCKAICSWPDVFVTKLNTTGTALVYSTYIGGSAYDSGNAIAVDSQGNASVAGHTESFDFPQKNGITAVLGANGFHAFVFTLDPTGSAINFSTFLGGESSDVATGIATDASGNIFVSGLASSAFFPVTAGHLIGSVPSQLTSDLFLAKFSRTGKLGFITLVGGSSLSYPGTFSSPSVENHVSVAVDSAGEAVLAGSAFDGFPATAGAYQPTFPTLGQQSAFLAKLNNTGTALLYGTYLSGPSGSVANDVALDAQGNIYTTGYAYPPDFPTTDGAFQTTATDSFDATAFVTKLDPTLSNLIYSTYVGPIQPNQGGGVMAASLAVDSQGNAHIAGTTSSPIFPLVSPVMSSLASSIFGNINGAFLSVLNPTGSALLFSTYFAGSFRANANAVAVGLAGNPYITGVTQDTDFPTTAGAFQRTVPPADFQQQHAFVTKFVLTTGNAAACFSTNTLYFGIVQTGQSSLPLPLTVSNCGTRALKVSSVSVSSPAFVVTQNKCGTVAVGASCVIQVRFSPLMVNVNDSGVLKINDNAPVSPQNVQMIGYSATPGIAVPDQLAASDGVVGIKGFPVLTSVQNTSFALPLHITKVVASGSDFTAINQCPTEVNPSDYCLVGFTFTPKAVGLRSGQLSIYDDAPGSPQTITLVGTGVAQYPTPVISYVSPGSAPVGSQALSLFLIGANFFPASKLTLNGTTVPLTSSSDNTLQAVISASLMTTMGNVTIKVVNPAPGGASAPYNFAVYKQVTLGAADVIYEPFTRKFYASIPARAPSGGNNLLTVDPVTGTVGAPIPIGNDPGALGLSSDGTTLYVALNGNNSILPFNVLTQKPGTEIPLGADPQRGPLTAVNIQVQPNHPANLIATLGLGGFNNPAGLDWIKNGKVITQYLNDPPSNVAVAGGKFVGTNDFFASSPDFSQGGIFHFVVSGNSLLQAPAISTTGFRNGPLDSDGKRLYSAGGEIFDVASGTLLGNFTGPKFSGQPATTILAETNSGRVFTIDPNNGLLAFDSTTFQQIGNTILSTNYQAARLTHWGANGISFLSTDSSFNAYDLVLFRSPSLYPSLGPNLLPVISSVSPSPVTAKGSNFLLTVNGSQFTRGAVVQWNGVTRTTQWVSATKLTADIQASEIKAPGTAKITVVNPGPGGGASSTFSLTIQ